MSFEVDPQAVRRYADDLAAARSAADEARKYVNRHGEFSGHEKGLIGTVIGSHENFVTALNQMLGHLMDLADASDASLRQLAEKYERTDEDAAARTDAAYPAVPRIPFKQD
jgi:Excreted virulence factor EspC, type VII ESX diderm